MSSVAVRMNESGKKTAPVETVRLGGLGVLFGFVVAVMWVNGRLKNIEDEWNF